MLDGHCLEDEDCEEGKLVAAGNGKKSLISNCHYIDRRGAILKDDLHLNSGRFKLNLNIL